MTRIVPLGTNGYFPSYGRQTMSFLVLSEGQALLLDVGTGVSRLVEPAVSDLLKPYSELDIILSHYHLDHVAGLSYLPEVWEWGRVRVFGPGQPLVDSDPKTAFNQFLVPPLFSLPYSSFPMPFEIVTVRDEKLQVGRLAVRVWRQQHPGGSIGIRIGDEIAYLTDTAVQPENGKFVQGVKLLLHELWLTDGEAAREQASGHSYFSAVAEFAKAAGVRSVMLVHHHPKRTPFEVQELSERMAEATGLPVPLVKEGQTYELQ